LNRAICDADLVIPVGCIRRGAWDPQRGAFGGLFPAFSDQGARQQMRQLMRLAEAARSPSLQKVTDEIGWLLGSMMSVQVVPGADDGLLDVLCGEVQAVMDRGRARYDAAWTMIVPGGADLVIAAISGDARQQTWTNVARALAAARQVVSATGSIALCTELAVQPGPGVKSLIEVADPYDARAELEQSQAGDVAIAEELSLALEQGSVFLRSQLEADLVEALGMVPLEDDEQVARLTGRFQSCILLGHAQYANPRVEELV
jgi:hypothetical protein